MSRILDRIKKCYMWNNPLSKSPKACFNHTNRTSQIFYLDAMTSMHLAGLITTHEWRLIMRRYDLWIKHYNVPHIATCELRYDKHGATTPESYKKAIKYAVRLKETI